MLLDLLNFILGCFTNTLLVETVSGINYTCYTYHPYSKVGWIRHIRRGWDVGQAVEQSAVKVWILMCGDSILHGRCLFCDLGYFPFQPVIHDWSIKGCTMYCLVCGKVHIKDPLSLIGKSSLCGNSGMPLKKYVTMTMRLLSKS